MAGLRSESVFCLLALVLGVALGAPVEDMPSGEIKEPPVASEMMMNSPSEQAESVLKELAEETPSEKDTKQVDLLMPDVQPQEDDAYVCTQMKLEGNEPIYLTGFVPHAKKAHAHHMLLYGCSEPGERKNVWNCGEMMKDVDDLRTAPVCASGSQILYAWAMDAPKLDLPADVGFKVGGDTAVQWLVLQVHYKDTTDFKLPKNQKDSSGLSLITTTTPQSKRAGVYLMGTSGEIPAHSTTYMETACGLSQPVIMHPFAFRTHAHTHGKVVSGYRIRGEDWEEIGRKSPQEPQMFYPVTHPGMTVQQGDILAARCTMVNDEDRTVFIGNTQHDEMCNFYIMYWVAGDELVSDDTCFSEGPPRWYWSDAQATLHVEHTPGNASVVPGTSDVLQSTVKFFKAAQQEFDDIEDNVKSDFMQLLDQWETGMAEDKWDSGPSDQWQNGFDDEMSEPDPRGINDLYGNYGASPYYRQTRDDYRWEDMPNV